MSGKGIKAFIVEGESREKFIIDNINRIFFSDDAFEIITLPAGQNIYMLWNKLVSDDFNTDIIELLRELNKDIDKQLGGLCRNDFSEVYLFFDYDVQQENIRKELAADALVQMLNTFNNETDLGKLYISYPMVEALRDICEGTCATDENCFIAIKDINGYKSKSAKNNKFTHFHKYDFSIWQNIIEVFIMRLSCLWDLDDLFTYEDYVDNVDPLKIYEKIYIKSHDFGIFVLSAFPEFIIDYFGKEHWNKCIKKSSCYKGANCSLMKINDD